MTEQLNRDDLAGMTPEAIARAHDDGALDGLLGVPDDALAVLEKARGTGPLDPADVAALGRLCRHDLIAAAYEAGRVDLTTKIGDDA